MPYGGGSSVVGGVEPRFDGPAVTLDLGRLDRVLEVDATSRAARVQGGVLGPHLEDQLRPHGLTLRHFPQSFEFSTLGGWLATRAGGHFATLHTHIDDLTESMRVVTPAGVTETRRLPGSGAGPSPDRLFLGSEGTLGVITEAWMRLQERPRWRRTASVRFASFERAVRRHPGDRAVRPAPQPTAGCSTRPRPPQRGTSTGGGRTGARLRVGRPPVDHASTEPSRSPRSTAARRPPTSGRGGRRGHGGARRSSGCPTSATRWPGARWSSRRSRRRAPGTASPRCTPRSPPPHGRSAERVCGAAVVTCRFTHVYPDGPAPYYGVYAPGRWGSLVEQWDEVKASVSRAIVDHGGTITHHHAVGRDHRPGTTSSGPTRSPPPWRRRSPSSTRRGC